MKQLLYLKFSIDHIPLLSAIATVQLIVSVTRVGDVVERRRGKDVSVFKYVRIIGQHQSKRTIKEIAELTGIGLRCIQRIIKTWKYSDEPSTSRNKCGREKTRNRSPLKRLVNKNRKNLTSELAAMFNTGHKGHINTHKRRELKGME
ncbi:hypothetical protein AVEN_19643-1 [Araneus ventricosus]|uniref:Uncharacterized protein n=1 Tax=Araneus ventricosus TaxID=182803 RepID=A0A4Y2C284_ARAVE|nr:hypothetical protein AVEN_19643-1 [Araneus ventricosus]